MRLDGWRYISLSQYTHCIAKHPPQYEKTLGQRPILNGSAEAIIEAFNGLGAALAAQGPPPDVTVQHRDEKANGVSVRIYTPPAASGKKLPLCVYYHGGGYLVGDLNSEDAWCRVIAKNTPCILVSVDYRLSTTHKLPVMLEDSLTAYKWVSPITNLLLLPY